MISKWILISMIIVVTIAPFISMKTDDQPASAPVKRPAKTSSRSNGSDKVTPDEKTPVGPRGLNRNNSKNNNNLITCESDTNTVPSQVPPQDTPPIKPSLDRLLSDDNKKQTAVPQVNEKSPDTQSSVGTPPIKPFSADSSLSGGLLSDDNKKQTAVPQVNEKSPDTQSSVGTPPTKPSSADTLFSGGLLLDDTKKQTDAPQVNEESPDTQSLDGTPPIKPSSADTLFSGGLLLDDTKKQTDAPQVNEESPDTQSLDGTPPIKPSSADTLFSGGLLLDDTKKQTDAPQVNEESPDTQSLDGTPPIKPSSADTPSADGSLSDDAKKPIVLNEKPSNVQTSETNSDLNKPNDDTSQMAVSSKYSVKVFNWNVPLQTIYTPNGVMYVYEMNENYIPDLNEWKTNLFNQIHNLRESIYKMADAIQKLNFDDVIRTPLNTPLIVHNNRMHFRTKHHPMWRPTLRFHPRRKRGQFNLH